MLSKAQIKYIRSLSQQKYRKEHEVFIAEGDKIAREWLGSDARILQVIGLKEWIKANRELIERHSEAELFEVEEHVLSSVSSLQTAHQVLLVIKMPATAPLLPTDQWCIALDNIQDPGNMGTIIRIADWFGIPNLVCSPDCADPYNPKVIQSAMGSHTRVKLFESDLENWLSSVTIPVLAATLEGNSVYSQKPYEKAVLIIGNESKGIHPSLINKNMQQISIPRLGRAESLNAAVATGIICSHLIRKELV